MTTHCTAARSDEDFLDYWTGSMPGDAAHELEEHLFSCAACSERFTAMATLGAGLASLVRRGRVAGIVSRSLLNRIQRDGVQVRQFTLFPGERVPCAAFPEDDLMVVSLRADFSGSNAVTLSVTGPEDSLVGRLSDVPVTSKDVEILWATPGDTVRQMSSTRLRLTLTSQAPDAAVLGVYELEHTSLEER